MNSSSEFGPTGPRTVAPARATHVPGEPGLWILLFGDMVVFSALFGVFIHAHADDAVNFSSAQGALDQTLGALNTVLLLTASLFVVLGIRAMRGQAWDAARGLLIAAMLCAGGFVVTKYFEWSHHLAADHGPSSGDFWMYYFALTGLHLFHVLIGMVALSYLLAKARHRQPLTPARIVFVEGAGCFWHTVDILWIVLFPVVYLVGA